VFVASVTRAKTACVVLHCHLSPVRTRIIFHIISQKVWFSEKKNNETQNACFDILCSICLNVVCFLLGNSPVSEFYMPTFRTTPFHLQRLMKMEQTESSETSEYKIQTLGNYPEESIQYSEQGVSLKSGICLKHF